jgi:hypothetical protein
MDSPLGTEGDAEGVAAERMIVVETVWVIVACWGIPLDTAPLEFGGMEGEETEGGVAIFEEVICACESTAVAVDRSTSVESGERINSASAAGTTSTSSSLCDVNPVDALECFATFVDVICAGGMS